jgi:hypothetical protein
LYGVFQINGPNDEFGVLIDVDFGPDVHDGEVRI